MGEIPVIKGCNGEHPHEIQPQGYEKRRPAETDPNDGQTPQVEHEDGHQPTKIKSILLLILQMLRFVVSIKESTDESDYLTDSAHWRKRGLGATMAATLGHARRARHRNFHLYSCSIFGGKAPVFPTRVDHLDTSSLYSSGGPLVVEIRIPLTPGCRKVRYFLETEKPKLPLHQNNDFARITHPHPSSCLFGSNI